MIESRIPFSFIDKTIDVKRNELEYALYEDDDRKECMKLSAKIDALHEIKSLWLKEESKFVLKSAEVIRTNFIRKKLVEMLDNCTDEDRAKADFCWDMFLKIMGDYKRESV